MKTNSWLGDYLLLLWNNTAAANIGNAGGLLGSSVAGSFYLSLHTAYPGQAGTQITSEAAYTSYARAAVARSSAGFTVAEPQVTNAAVVNFPQSGSGPETEYFVGVGRLATAAGTLDHICPIGSELGEGTGAVTGNIITIPGQTTLVNDRIAFFACNHDALPGGIVAGTVYFVITSSGDTLTVSLTLGGAAVAITTAGGVLAWKMTGLVVNNLITPTIAIGAFKVVER